jgi:beta-alanine degradation protein BauB
VLDYFWTAVDDGSGRSHLSDGTTHEVEYARGETRHHNFARGEYLLHDLENTGTAALVFVTVEFKGGANAPLALD